MSEHRPRIISRIFATLFGNRTTKVDDDKKENNAESELKWLGIREDSKRKSKKKLQSKNSYHMLESTEIMPSYKTSAIHEKKIAFGIRENPNLWTETVIDTKQKCNKIFASSWIDDKRVIFGTKDNKLMLLYCDNKRKKTDLKEISLPNLQNNSNESNVTVGNCGMHDIAVNPCRNWIASGGYNTNEICLLSFENNYDETHIEPIRIFKHHKDWIFGLDWFDGSTLLSGGRDGKLNIWKPAYKFISTPHYTETIENDGIRAIKSHSYNNNIVLLTVNGDIKIWDINKTKIVWNSKLKYNKEAVCLNINKDKGQIIVGSQAHISIMDPRDDANKFKYVQSVDQGWGVRTVSAQYDLLTIGGGLGRLSFYDLRNNQYIKYTKNKYFAINPGWTRQDDIYTNVFIEHQLPTPTAIYSHCYSPNHNKLFVGGGPTPFGLFGSFVSIFS